MERSAIPSVQTVTTVSGQSAGSTAQTVSVTMALSVSSLNPMAEELAM